MSDESDTAAPGGARAVPDLGTISGPGLHVLIVDDPETEARRVAGELDAELVRGDGLRRALDGRMSHDGHAAERRLLERRASAGPGDQIRVMTDIDGLRNVARKLARSERILGGTQANMTEMVGQKTGGGLTVHPSSIRAAAADLVKVRAELEQLEADRGAMAEQIGSSDDPGDGPGADHEEDSRSDDALGGVSAATKRRIAGVIVMSVGVAIVLGALLAVAAGVVALVALVIPALAVWWAFDQIRIENADQADKAAASANLAIIGARTDDVFGESLLGEDSGVASAGIPATSSGQLRLLDGRIDLLRERERSAASHWRELIGRDADPAEVEQLLRERDPQFFAAVEMVDVTSQARAAAAHHRRVQARWRVLWAGLDREAPDPDGAEDAVRDLEAKGVEAITITTRRGEPDDVELARSCLDALGEDPGDARSLVVIDTGHDVPPDLVEGLQTLAERTSVVVLSPPEPSQQDRV